MRFLASRMARSGVRGAPGCLVFVALAILGIPILYALPFLLSNVGLSLAAGIVVGVCLVKRFR